MAEWFKAVVLKTIGCVSCPLGSNPSRCASSRWLPSRGDDVFTKTIKFNTRRLSSAVEYQIVALEVEGSAPSGVANKDTYSKIIKCLDLL